MKKLLLSAIVIALLFGASKLVCASDNGQQPADPNTPVADANAISE